MRKFLVRHRDGRGRPLAGVFVEIKDETAHSVCIMCDDDTCREFDNVTEVRTGENVCHVSECFLTDESIDAPWLSYNGRAVWFPNSPTLWPTYALYLFRPGVFEFKSFPQLRRLFVLRVFGFEFNILIPHIGG